MTDDPIPLAFAPGPLETLERADQWNTKAATIRYRDEKGIETGDTLHVMTDAGSEPRGTAEVLATKTVPARRALDVVQHHWAEYDIQTPAELVTALNHYYPDNIHLESDVKVLILDPDVEVDDGD